MANTADHIPVDHDDLTAFARELSRQAGLSDEHARLVSRALVRANLRGVDSHGVVRLEPYIRSIEHGGFNSDPDVTITRPSRSSLIVDGDDGPGQVATVKAMDAAVEAARETGVAFASVRNSNHFGTAAYYTQRAAAEDCIGFTMSNVGPNVAPFGGIDPFFGTNPLAFSIPTNRHFSITLDMATSVVAKGKIHVAEEEGEQIPERWAMDDQGNPVTDPADVHALRPVGGPKGYGLGLLVDVCSGVLSGMGVSPDVDSLYDDYSNPQGVGHWVGAIDPSFYRELPTFKAEIDDLITRLKAVRPKDGVDEIKLPGEIEAETRAERERNGIPLGPGVVATLTELADRYEVAFPADHSAD
ncbi:Ldh family oxidoreductase [Halorarum salinum]|uniref:Ldh family oxidoreductase n=1 Tax=Halorarum salinum TaxID=2743089 RepID=A0A7D5QBN7_9EURY|nr:Ldh family oxidoreductase [Halobaculum salinum]QLG61061.1 Ldh family oxidoreductase [Halobaculum salinum]